MDGLLHELKRRNVFKVGLAYLALGWVVIQVTESAVPALNLPETLNTIVFFLGLIGFPFAVLFAWAFELTPEGLKRSYEVREEQSVAHITGRKLDFFIIGLLALALVGVIYDAYISPTQPDTAAKTDTAIAATPSIAVLAFENISADKNQDYFADGISEEILNLLAKTQAMKVAGRTSSFSFKGSKDDIPTIADKLNVNHVLEGSVRKSGTTLRITAQLIRDDGYHVWSETYDREMDDIFKIQDEISTAIMKELKVRLLGEVTASPERGTDNIVAYEKFLMAKELLRQRRTTSIEHAVTLLKEVISQDPSYASAHAQLAIAYMLLSHEQYGNLTLEEEKRLSLASIEKSAAIDPNNIDMLAAKGLFYSNGTDEHLALSHLDRILKIQPNHANALRWKGNILGGMGRDMEALAEYKKIVDNDPLWVAALNNYADVFIRLGRFEEVEQILEKIERLSPDVNFNTNLKAQTLAAQGRQGEAVITYLSGNHIKLTPFDISNLNFELEKLDLLRLAPALTPFNTAYIYLARGEKDKAISWAEEALKGDNSSFTIHIAYDIFWRIGDIDRTTDEARKIYKKHQAKLQNNKSHFFSCFWGPRLTYLLREELDVLSQQALLSSCKNFIENQQKSKTNLANYIADSIRLAVAEGRAKDALDHLKSAAENNILPYESFAISLFDELKALPGYPAVMAEIAAHRKAESEKVLAWLKDHPDVLKRMAPKKSGDSI